MTSKAKKVPKPDSAKYSAKNRFNIARMSLDSIEQINLHKDKLEKEHLLKLLEQTFEVIEYYKKKCHLIAMKESADEFVEIRKEFHEGGSKRLLTPDGEVI